MKYSEIKEIYRKKNRNTAQEPHLIIFDNVRLEVTEYTSDNTICCHYYERVGANDWRYLKSEC